MKGRAIVAGLFFIVAVAYAEAGAKSLQFTACADQRPGHTSDGESVVVCLKLFASPPYVRLPQDQHTGDRATIYGVVELNSPTASGVLDAVLYDRDLGAYDLLDSAGKPIDDAAALAKKNRLPSNRVQYLVYEATGKVVSPPSSGDGRLQLTGLRPVVLVDGYAIDERFLGPWEGVVSKRFAPRKWYTDEDPAHYARIRVNFTALM